MMPSASAHTQYGKLLSVLLKRNVFWEFISLREQDGTLCVCAIVCVCVYVRARACVGCCLIDDRVL